MSSEKMHRRPGEWSIFRREVGTHRIPEVLTYEVHFHKEADIHYIN